MKKIPLTQGKVALVDDEDYGEVSKHQWYLNNGYPVATINGKRMVLHVFLLGGAGQGNHTDHINRNKMDNRRSNLRIVPAKINIHNRRSYKGKSNPFYNKHHTSLVRNKISKIWSIPIIQITIAGCELKRWDNALRVQEELGISNGNINSVINGKRKTAGGFIWKRA